MCRPSSGTSASTIARRPPSGRRGTASATAPEPRGPRCDGVASAGPGRCRWVCPADSAAEHYPDVLRLRDQRVCGGDRNGLAPRAPYLVDVCRQVDAGGADLAVRNGVDCVVEFGQQLARVLDEARVGLQLAEQRERRPVVVRIAGVADVVAVGVPVVGVRCSLALSSPSQTPSPSPSIRVSASSRTCRRRPPGSGSATRSRAVRGRRGPSRGCRPAAEPCVPHCGSRRQPAGRDVARGDARRRASDCGDPPRDGAGDGDRRVERRRRCPVARELGGAAQREARPVRPSSASGGSPTGTLASDREPVERVERGDHDHPQDG
jgi:hypothetical protein